MSELRLDNIQIRHVGPVALSVAPGEIVCLSGGSGAGKSLLLRAIADMLPHEGDACLGEVCASNISAPKWRASVALLPAEAQWWYETVEQHFIDKDETLLSTLGFSVATWGWQLSRCSTGERQRLGLLRCLSRQPQCLLLDEPTGSLDPENTRRVEEIVMDYAQAQQTPVIWVSHSVEQIQRIASRHFMMRDGQLVQQ